MNYPFIESDFTKKDQVFEKKLRPQKLREFIGQTPIIERLEVSIGAAKKRGEPLGHCLFHGPPGLGKTTLAAIVANELGTNLVVTSGPMIEKPGDLAGILTHLQEGDVLFIDEVHRLSRQVEEYLYPAMEDFKLDLLLDSGPGARSVQVDLNHFTMVAATTRSGLISSPMRSRFCNIFRLDYYPDSLLYEIIVRSCDILRVVLDKASALEISHRARGTPRIANNLLKWVRDFAQMRTNDKIDLEVTKHALKMLDIDEKGLDEMDKKILMIIIDHYEGGPVGVNTLGTALGEDVTTLSEVHEPYLIMQGFLKRTLRGREATKLAYQHLGRPLPINQGENG